MDEQYCSLKKGGSQDVSARVPLSTAYSIIIIMLYMASGFPPIAVTDGWRYSFTSHSMLTLAPCNVILSVVPVPYQYHWTACSRLDVCISSPLCEGEQQLDVCEVRGGALPALINKDDVH